MKSIYQNSYLTIAAAASKESSKGLFAKHDAAVYKIFLQELANLNRGSRSGSPDSLLILSRKKCLH
jgi:hypothetical protein